MGFIKNKLFKSHPKCKCDDIDYYIKDGKYTLTMSKELENELKKPKYHSMEVALYIIQKYHNDKKIISNIRLNAVLYFIQCIYIANQNRQCFNEDIEAWGCGGNNSYCLQRVL